jgi:amino acid adenylation domain-containing protein
VTARLHEYARRSAEREPDATAVVLDDDRLTYGALELDSNRLARFLRDAGVGRGDRVALLVAKSPAAIVGMHATLKAGAAYVPVDLASPPARAAMVLRSAEPRAILAGTAAAPLLEGLVAEDVLRDVVIVSMDEERQLGAAAFPADWERLSGEPDDVAVGPEALAHILFTSGSTGVPKGVQITHAMADAFVAWAIGHFGTAPGERISSHPPLHFDLSTFDVYATLRAGAELHIVPPGANLLPGALAAFIRDRELTQWFSVPSTLAFMARADVIADGDFPALRRVLFCGEPMPVPVLAHWMLRVPHARYTNLYGPTETTIASSYYDVPAIPEDEAASLPIGVPCDGEELLVLDENLELLPPGERGEIFIGGVALSPGYWRDDEKTRGAFLPDPRDSSQRLYRTGDLGWVDENGLLRYSGRADSQIKHRGYRIELGEIEVALNAVAGVRECAVVSVTAPGFEGTTICCAYAPASPDAAVPGIRAALARSLPAYMLPTRWLVMEALPKNQNGKIDRRAVRESFAAEASPAGVAR